jgi:hypothetical protein
VQLSAAMQFPHITSIRIELDGKQFLSRQYDKDHAREIKLPPAKPEVYCLSASKALVTHEPPEGGYSPNFIWS